MPYAQINNTKLYYEKEGRGTHILFLHGYTLDHRVMKLLGENFKKNYCTIFLDVKGHGKSDKPYYSYALNEFVQDIKSFLDYHRIGNIIIVGYSMGGFFALELANAYPNLVQGLVLIASGLRYGEPQHQKVITKSGLRKEDIRKIPDVTRKYTNVINAARIMVPDYVKEKLNKELHSFDFRKKASFIQQPTLLIAGEIDEYFPLTIQHEMKNAIIQAKLHILIDTTHGVIFEKSKESLELIGSFFKEHNLY